MLEGKKVGTQKPRERDTRDLKDSELCLENPERCICPVCGNSFGNQLPGTEDVVGQVFYLDRTVKIVDSALTIQYEFHHFLEEDGVPLDESHPLIALIRVVFDSAGDCISLELLRISAGR